MATLQSTDTYSKFISAFTTLGPRVAAVKDLIVPTVNIKNKLSLIADALNNYQNGNTSSIVFPYSEILSLKEAIKILIYQVSPVLDVPFDFVLLLRETIRQLSNLSLIKEVFVSREQSQEAVVNIFSSTPLPKKSYKILYGDTLIGIANRLMPGIPRADAVAQIISLNELDYPYLMTDHSDELPDPTLNVARMGDSIFVPQSANVSRNAIIPSRDEQLASLFGKDIQLQGYSSVTTDPTAGTVLFDSSGDLAVMSGKDNLVQALQLRILTEKGSLPLHPTYGASFRRWLGATMEQRNVQLAAFEVGRAVMEDPRVSSVEGVTGSADPDVPTVMFVRFVARIIGADSPLSLNLVIPQ